MIAALVAACCLDGRNVSRVRDHADERGVSVCIGANAAHVVLRVCETGGACFNLVEPRDGALKIASLFLCHPQKRVHVAECRFWADAWKLRKDGLEILDGFRK